MRSDKYKARSKENEPVGGKPRFFWRTDSFISVNKAGRRSVFRKYPFPEISVRSSIFRRTNVRSLKFRRTNRLRVKEEKTIKIGTADASEKIVRVFEAKDTLSRVVL